MTAPRNDPEGYRDDLTLRQLDNPKSLAFRIVETVKATPGIHTTTLADTLGVGRGYLHVVIHRMRAVGVLAPPEEFGVVRLAEPPATDPAH
jgi:hypothetical protein